MTDLFKDTLTPYSGPKKSSMKLYEYLTRSSGSAHAAMRTFWNAVYRESRLSKQTKNDIRGRFTSAKDDQHLGAMFELFIYEFMRRIGCKVKEARSFKSGKPDFIVTYNDRYHFYLEASCIIKDTTCSKEEIQKNRVLDTIRGIESDCFRVCIKLDGTIMGKFNCKKLKSEVEQWLSCLDYNDLLHRRKRNVPGDIADEQVFKAGGMQVCLRPIPIVPRSSSAATGLIRCGPTAMATRVCTSESIKRKLNDKAKQCRSARLPVIVAVNVINDFVDDEEIMNALFGQLQYTVSRQIVDGEPARIDMTRGVERTWKAGGDNRSTKLSALILFRNVDCCMILSHRPKLVLNPFARTKSIPLDLPVFRYCEPSSDGLSLITVSPRRSKAETDWLNQWPLPRFI